LGIPLAEIARRIGDPDADGEAPLCRLIISQGI
jgi:hypothetical protein